MGFFDFLVGQRPDKALPGYASGLIDEVRNSMPGIGQAAKQGKHLWKTYETNPEELATQSLNQGAVERQTATEDYGAGDNALFSQYGGEGQASLLQRMKENRIAKINQQQAINAQGEAANKGFAGLNIWNQGIQNRDATQTARYGQMANIMAQNAYDRSRKGGLFGADTLGNAVAAFAGGAGSALKMPCWIADALYGEMEPETIVLRHWIGNVWPRKHLLAALGLKLYIKFGERVAAVVKRSRAANVCARFVFDRLLRAALAS